MVISVFAGERNEDVRPGSVAGGAGSCTPGVGHAPSKRRRAQRKYWLFAAALAGWVADWRAAEQALQAEAMRASLLEKDGEQMAVQVS